MSTLENHFQIIRNTHGKPVAVVEFQDDARAVRELLPPADAVSRLRYLWELDPEMVVNVVLLVAAIGFAVGMVVACWMRF